MNPIPRIQDLWEVILSYCAKRLDRAFHSRYAYDYVSSKDCEKQAIISSTVIRPKFYFYMSLK